MDEFYSLFFYNRVGNEFEGGNDYDDQIFNGWKKYSFNVTINDLVPKDHLIRKIDAAINFDFVYPIVEQTYSTFGRPSIDPVILVKLVFIQYLFGIHSMRQTIKEVDTNLAYRWLLGLILMKKYRIFLHLEKIMYDDLERPHYLKISSLIF